MNYQNYQSVMLLTSSNTKWTLMHLFLFTNSAQRELVSICTQSINNCNYTCFSNCCTSFHDKTSWFLLLLHFLFFCVFFLSLFYQTFTYFHFLFKIIFSQYLIKQIIQICFSSTPPLFQTLNSPPLPLSSIKLTKYFFLYFCLF